MAQGRRNVESDTQLTFYDLSENMQIIMLMIIIVYVEEDRGKQLGTDITRLDLGRSICRQCWSII